MGLFLVSDDDHHAILSDESLPQPFRLVDGAVLSSRASKRDHQVREFQCSIAAHGLFDQERAGFGKLRNGRKLLKILLNGTLQSV